MLKRFLPHLSSILFLHVALLFGSWQLMLHDLPTTDLNLGTSVLKLQVASSVLMPRPLASKLQTRPQAEVPTPKESAISEEVPVAATAENSIAPHLKENMRNSYMAELRARIDANKFYPPMSRRLGQTGTVIVAFTLLEDGHIINIRIDTPSRYEALNESAMEAVKKVHVFKPIPKEVGESQMDIKVPLKFFTI